ncbi:MAG: tRNA-queuosine alpha-mannosyltransferase domain-containing protein [Thermodesulfobacteriota bacterium]
MRILLLSAYDTPSHSNWCKGLQQHLPELDWNYITLPPRHFPWRIRGNPISWYATCNQELDRSYDIVLATSMVDLATLCGIFPGLGRACRIVYFHENQFAYPLSKSPKRGTVEPMMVNLYAALSADKVVFNSEYNLNTFLRGARDLLKKMPDLSFPGIISEVEKKSWIIPVPVQDFDLESRNNERIPNSLVWNHRWEYDKNPDDFFQACYYLKSWDVPFKLIVMGQQFRQHPGEFDRAREQLRDNILVWGEQSKEDYCSWLGRGEWAVSTANHEFQGVALMEAVRAGNIPVVPDRLSYPEFFRARYRFGQNAEDLANFLKENLQKKLLSPPDLHGFSWKDLAPEYRALFQKC